MSIRQPDECICFGGRCLRRLCPNQPKKPKSTSAYDSNTRQRRKKVRTLSESLKEREQDKENVNG